MVRQCLLRLLQVLHAAADLVRGRVRARARARVRVRGRARARARVRVRGRVRGRVLRVLGVGVGLRRSIPAQRRIRCRRRRPPCRNRHLGE